MMKNLILLTAMNTMLATALNAQTPMIPTNNWLAANRAVLGTNTPANWLLDLDADDMEVYVTANHALVLVDRMPIMNTDGAAFLRKSVTGLGGSHLSLVGEVESVNDSVMRGTYSGLLGGTAVLMDQYVQLRNGVPVTIIRVINRVNGSAPNTLTDSEDLALGLLRATDESGLDPALTRN
ncbi:MAG: hypothetical protein IPK70_12765 [Flavobacteriales bacterium]|jgi:hypothetical protein|nr:hypothetical protein [Flavobacteriales bacterium]